MNNPDDIVTNYPKANAVVINDPRIFRGVLTAAKAWGSNCLDDPNAAGSEELDELMADFASKIADLQAKYEVRDDTLNGKTRLGVDYYHALNTLLTKYRTRLFEAALDYVSDDTAIDLMRDLLEDNNTEPHPHKKLI